MDEIEEIINNMAAQSYALGYSECAYQNGVICTDKDLQELKDAYTQRLREARWGKFIAA